MDRRCARWAAATAVGLLLLGCPRREPSTEPTSAVPSTSSAGGAHAPLPVAPDAGSLHPAFGERVDERARLVRAIALEGVKDQTVLAAMRRVPRHAFVAATHAESAYADRPLPIGSGQTISQPYIVAFMTAAAAPKATDRCLEIGTGSGYQAAVLAEICARTYSIEYIPELAKTAERTLRGLGYDALRVELRTGDGYRGWPEAAPFDVVVVTAAPEQVPLPLLEQLAVGGRLVIPVGPSSRTQALELWTRIGKGEGAEAFERKRLLDVRFVPFLGEGSPGKR